MQKFYHGNVGKPGKYRVTVNCSKFCEGLLETPNYFIIRLEEEKRKLITLRMSITIFGEGD